MENTFNIDMKILVESSAQILMEDFINTYLK